MSSSLYFFIGGDKILLVEYHAKVVHVLVLMEADDDSGSLTVWTLWWRRIPLKEMNDSIWESVIERSLCIMVTCLYTPRRPLYSEVSRGHDLLSLCVHVSSLYSSIDYYRVCSSRYSLVWMVRFRFLLGFSTWRSSGTDFVFTFSVCMRILIHTLNVNVPL